MKDLQPRIDPHMNDTVTNVPDWLVFIKVLTRGVRSMAAGSICSAGISGKIEANGEINWDLILGLISINESAVSAECGCVTKNKNCPEEEDPRVVLIGLK